MTTSNADKRKTIFTYIKRFFIVLFTTLILIVGALMLVMLEISEGPSESWKEYFVCTVRETSALKFLASWYYTPEQIAEYEGSGRNSVTNEVTDPGLIQMNQKVTHEKNENTDGDDIPSDSEKPSVSDEPISVVDISGGTYKGKLMMVRDPSKVVVGISGRFGEEYEGKTVMNMLNSYGAVAATNAGGFYDEGGVGNGGVPLGIVVSQGKLCYGSMKSTYEVIGFDKENILRVGKMTGQQAMDVGIRDAVSFGPILLVNGKPQNEEKKLGGGFNPRTAIGQTSDGTVLILVIDGRQIDSLGATYDDLITIMQEYGAVNAANLDGGSSSHMIYNGEIITTCSSLYGPRRMPTCIMVMP